MTEKNPFSKIKTQMFHDQQEYLRPIKSGEEYTKMETAEIEETM